MEKAIFASGCFWGVQYHFERQDGVLNTSVGYIGSHTEEPSYRDVCTGTTGHAEAIEVEFNEDLVSFEDLAKLFFETHDPSQVNRQGPDIGTQYRSEIFYLNEAQRKTSEQLILHLKNKGLAVATTLSPASR